MRRPFFCCAASAFPLVFLWAVPALAQLAPNLTGTWKAKEGDVTVTLLLNADGTGKLDNAKIKYAVRGRTLSIDDSGTVNNYSFELAGNKLTVSGGDLKQPMLFEREGATAAGGLGARRQAPAGKTAADAPSTASSGPAGAWEMKTPGGVITMVLNEDGTGNFAGDAGKWKFERGILMVSGGTSTYMFTAAITPTTMTLTNATLPQPLVFTRAGAPAGEAEPASAAAPASPRPSDSIIGDWQGPKGLVRFAADGSMVMQGEKYRYTIQGSTLTMIARDGAAPFQYKLAGDTLTLSAATGTITLKRLSGAAGAGAEAGGKAAGGGKVKKNHPKTGDAMLCLDGKCFTTALQRPPWR